MRNKFLSIFAAGSLLAACECAPEQQDVAVVSSPTPGSSEDFKHNTKDRVFFELNKSKLSSEAAHTLETQAAWLKTYPNTKATVEGHCDSRGTREYNLALGQRRATSAAHALTSHGVTKDRVKTVSYGKDRPVNPGSDEAAHAENRVAITVVE